MKVLSRPDGLPSIAYDVAGSGEPLVLVHGVGGESGNWDDVAARLAHFCVIRLDLRGHGRSAPIRGQIRVKDLARDVTDVMNELGVKRARLAGFSLGGMVVQSVALAEPQRVEKLAVLGAVCGRTPEERARAKERIEFLRQNGLAAIAESNRERWFTDAFRAAHPDKVQARVQQLLTSDAESYLQSFTVFCTTDHAERLHELRMPVLIVTGEHDVAATPRMARLMHERIAASVLEIVPGMRHSLLIEAPERVAALLDGFF